MKKIISFGFLLSLMVTIFCAAPMYAQTAQSDPSFDIAQTTAACGVCETAESKSFAKSAPGKLGRGVVNVSLGWTNLFAQPIKAGTSGGNVLNGIGNGFVQTFYRTVQGVVE